MYNFGGGGGGGVLPNNHFCNVAVIDRFSTQLVQYAFPFSTIIVLSLMVNFIRLPLSSHNECR